MLCEQVGEHGEYIIVLELALYVDGETFSCVLINDSQHAEGPPIVRPVSYEVVGPHVAFMLWPQTNAGAVVKPEPAAFGLLLWDFEPLASPDPFNPFEVHIPTFTLNLPRWKRRIRN